MRREGRAGDGGGCATVRQSTAHVYLMFSSSLTGMAGARAPRRESAEFTSRATSLFTSLLSQSRKDSLEIDVSCSYIFHYAFDFDPSVISPMHREISSFRYYHDQLLQYCSE